VPSEYDISLNIRNNRNYAQTFNGMGGSVNPLDTSNATTEYRYNITTFNFTDENSITIYYKAVSQSVFSSFTAELPSQNPEGLVIALNGLGIGFFNTYVELGQTYLGTYNENYIFGSLDVYNSSIPTTTTTSTSTTTTTIFVPTTTTTSTTSTTTSLAPTTSTTTTTTSLAPTTTSTTTTTTSLAPTTTSTTTTTTSLAPTTTSTTTTTTSLAPTTTSTTTSTTTEAATTTSTTTSTTTEAATTTSTTTTTTTLAFSGSVGYSGNDATVCFTPVATFTMTGNAGSFCASTIFTSASWGSVASGAYFIANGGNILPVNHILGENTATTSGACTACPITTTTTTTSTTSTTTTLPPTTTTTSTTTTTTTLAFSGSVGYSGNDATVCYTPVATFTMTGNAGSFCASTIFTSASWGAVASGAYFIAFGGDILPVNHVLGEDTATTSGACTACPITTTTTSTTTTTTSLPPTTTTTSTTTTTTTLAFSGSVGYSGNDATVCYTPVATFTMTGNAGSFCASTIFTSASWGAVASGAYFIANGGNILPVNHILGEDTATTSGACTACPITTTTTSTTTTTTSLPPTTTTTSTTSTTTTLAFSGSVAYSGNDATVCYTPVATFTMTGNAGSFCASTIFTSASWGAVASGAYFIAFGGNVLPVNHILGENTATTSGVCAACPITTTTTSTTSTTSTTTTAAPVTYTIDNAATGSPYGACTGSTTTSFVFAAPGNTVPIVGLVLYTLQNLTIPFVGSAGWRKLVQGGTSYAAEVDANGEITNYVTCASQTTTTTTTSTSTTSTTTTLPPVTLSLTPGCAGGPGLGTILANNFSGGTGSFEYISISATSQAEALTNLDNPATRTFINGATEYTFTTLPNSTYYVAIMDFSGNKGVNSTSVLCTTTTTTSTTSTTTTAAPVEYTIDSPATGSPFGACTGSTATTQVFAAPGNTSPIVTLILYTNQNLTSPFVGSAGWRKLARAGSSWAVVIDTNGEITDYATCASQTTTTTTSTTTTTTTSLAPFADVSISNFFFQGDITDVTVEGVTVSGISFPITIGNGATGTTTEIGLTQTIIIYYDNVLAGSRIEYTDGETGNFCDNISGGGSLTWSAADVVDGGTITITAGDGSCP
jgi:Fe-S cluster biogenesis protein NfuA